MLIEYFLTRYMHRYTSRLVTAAEERAPIEPGMATRDTAAVPMLYVHIPFCKELCPFCTFFRIPFDEQLARRYFRALRRQLNRYHDLGYQFSTVYFGGGTPTVLPDELALTIDEVRRLWPIQECSVETNPSDLTPSNIELLKTCGVNRLSVGVQSFQDNLLESVNRIRKYGTGADIQHRLSQIRGIFDTLNVDLIFGLEGQTHADVIADLGIVKQLGIDQVTCYPLMKSGGGRQSFDGWRREVAWKKQAYRLIRDTIEPEYVPSSAWCFSKNRGMIDEYIVEHSSYAGAGAGAFGLEGGTLAVNVFSVEKYIEAAENNADAAAFRHPFDSGENLRYLLLMQLFGGGIDFDGLCRGQTPLCKFFVRTSVALLRLAGAAVKKSGRITVAKRGAYYTVLLMKLFFEGVGDLRGFCLDAHASGTNLDTARPRA
ncbi:MAG: coproporphyrinogen III oxidase family protein [Spirochaetales bacterium]|nr:coproporphyrinogen III oxidase family protein [Spirochaetales bacterium]